MSTQRQPLPADETRHDSPIGLIGLGLVGSALYGRLLEHGIPVVGCDIDEMKVKRLVGTGGVGAASAAEVGKHCGVIFVSVMTSDQAAQAIFGQEGLLSDSSITRCVIDTTTADPAASESLARRLQGVSVSYLDAPLSGSSAQIREGDGVFLIGGDPAVYEAVRHILQIISPKSFHLGPSGSGSKAKIATNLILGLNRLAHAEGLVFADRMGLNLSTFVKLVEATPAYSRAVDSKAQKMLAGDFTPQSRISQHRKDLDIILANAARVGQPLPLAQVHHDLLVEAELGGLGDADTCAVIEQLRRLAR